MDPGFPARGQGQAGAGATVSGLNRDAVLSERIVLQDTSCLRKGAKSV